jgi:GNAT superfamily N-acetyltransferase
MTISYWEGALVTEYLIRAVKDNDAEALFALVGNCFSEYEGVFLDRDDLDSDLKAYETYIRELGGEGFVAIKEGCLVASVASAPCRKGAWEVKRLYLSASLRGSGMGPKLLRLAEETAHTGGARYMDCWTDTRFTRAHRFYEREGYVKQAETRDLGDISNTTEFYYIKTL